MRKSAVDAAQLQLSGIDRGGAGARCVIHQCLLLSNSCRPRYSWLGDPKHTDKVMVLHSIYVQSQDSYTRPGV